MQSKQLPKTKAIEHSIHSLKLIHKHEHNTSISLVKFAILIIISYNVKFVNYVRNYYNNGESLNGRNSKSD